MANYHLAMQVISRGSGRKAVAAAAYRRAERFYDERYDMVHDYSAKDGVAYSAFALPPGAPEWITELVASSENVSQDFWNIVEASEKRVDAQLAREIEFSLPVELTKEENIQLAKEYIEEQFVALGMVADWSVHYDNGNNPHVHCMLTTRPLEVDGFGKRKAAVLDAESGEPLRDKRGAIVYQRGDIWGSKEQIEQWREKWAAYQNFHLRMRGHSVQVDHRSYAKQGIEVDPTSKIGVVGMWMQRLGIASDKYDRHVSELAKNRKQILRNPDIVLHKISKQEAVFTEKEISREIDRYFEKGQADYAKAIDLVLQSELLVHLGAKRGQECFAIAPMIESERAMVESALALHESKQEFAILESTMDSALAVLNEEIKTATKGQGSLSPQQEEAAKYIMDDYRLRVLVGVAGAGKSTILKASNIAWQAHGYRVRGAALSGIAASNLQDSGVTAQTLHSLEMQWNTAEAMMDDNTGRPLTERQREFIQNSLLSARDILVIDEAGMVGSAQMQRVLSRVEAAGAKVVLVGDDEQLQSIEAGTAFKHIKEHTAYIGLDEVRRQMQDWQKQATIEFANTKTGAALQRYIDAGDVTLLPEGANSQLVNDYMRSHIRDSEASRMVLAYTKKDVNELNRAIQERMREAGELYGEGHLFDLIGQDNEGEFTYSEQFAVGDRLMFRENNQQMGVMNGTLGRITDISEENMMTVRLDNGKDVTFDSASYKKYQLGYAATVYKSQGVTVDEAYVKASRYFDRHSTYVAMSRHKNAVKLYAEKEQFKDLDELKRGLSRPRPKLSTLDFAVERGIQPSASLRSQIREFIGHAKDSIEAASEKVMKLWQRLEVAYGRIKDKSRGMEHASSAMADKTDTSLSSVAKPSRDERVLALRNTMLALAESRLRRALESEDRDKKIAMLQYAAKRTTQAIMLDRNSKARPEQAAAIEGRVRGLNQQYDAVLIADHSLAGEPQLRKSVAAISRSLTDLSYAKEKEHEQAKEQGRGLGE